MFGAAVFLGSHFPSSISFPWSSKLPKDWQGLHRLEKLRINYTPVSKPQLDHHRVTDTNMCAGERPCLRRG